MNNKITINGDITVKTMERSGIFISDHNIVNGWKSHAKSNIGFQVSGDGNQVENSVIVVSDPDEIDTPIDDRDFSLIIDNNTKENHSQFDLNSLNVNSVTHNSTVIVGNGNITGMDSHGKDNSSIGRTQGDLNQISRNLNLNNDRDIIDTPIYDQDIKVANSYGERN